MFFLQSELNCLDIEIWTINAVWLSLVFGSIEILMTSYEDIVCSLTSEEFLE